MSTLAERTAKYESLAKEFLASKERQKYYAFECESDDGRSSTHYLPLTDDDIVEIKALQQGSVSHGALYKGLGCR